MVHGLAEKDVMRILCMQGCLRRVFVDCSIFFHHGQWPELGRYHDIQRGNGQLIPESLTYIYCR